MRPNLPGPGRRQASPTIRWRSQWYGHACTLGMRRLAATWHWRRRSCLGFLSVWRGHALLRPPGHGAPSCVQRGLVFEGGGEQTAVSALRRQGPARRSGPRRLPVRRAAPRRSCADAGARGGRRFVTACAVSGRGPARARALFAELPIVLSALPIVTAIAVRQPRLGCDFSGTSANCVASLLSQDKLSPPDIPKAVARARGQGFLRGVTGPRRCAPPPIAADLRAVAASELQWLPCL